MKEESVVNGNSISVKTYLEVKTAEFVLLNDKEVISHQNVVVCGSVRHNLKNSKFNCKGET